MTIPLDIIEQSYSFYRFYCGWKNFLLYNQVILMERESADEWVDSYLGMLEFYNQNVRPW